MDRTHFAFLALWWVLVVALVLALCPHVRAQDDIQPGGSGTPAPIVGYDPDEKEDATVPVDHWQAAQLIREGYNIRYLLLITVGIQLYAVGVSAWGRWHKGD